MQNNVLHGNLFIFKNSNNETVLTHSTVSFRFGKKTEMRKKATIQSVRSKQNIQPFPAVSPFECFVYFCFSASTSTTTITTVHSVHRPLSYVFQTLSVYGIYYNPSKPGIQCLFCRKLQAIDIKSIFPLRYSFLYIKSCLKIPSRISRHEQTKMLFYLYNAI